jgi:hypothetical protein
VRSPVAGSIMDVQTKPGDSVKRGSNIVSVADLGQIFVILDLSGRNMPLIAGKAAEITFEGYPGGVFRGELQVEDTFKEKAESATGRIQLNNPELRLKLNMSAVVTLLGPRELAVVVKKTALVQKDNVFNVSSRLRLARSYCSPLRLTFSRAKTRWLQRASCPEIVSWPFLLHLGEVVACAWLVDCRTLLVLRSRYSSELIVLKRRTTVCGSAFAAPRYTPAACSLKVPRSVSPLDA